MLLFGRKPGQSVIITVPPSLYPTVIEVKVVNVPGDNVRIGTQVPMAVSVNRKEIQDRIEAESLSR